MTGSLRTRVLRNFGSLSLGRTLGDALSFLLFIALSRVYGEEGLGQYSIAMAWTGFLAVGVDFGLYSFAVREMNLPENCSTEGRRRVLGRVLGVRLMLSLFALIVLAGVVSFQGGQIIQIILWIGAYQILYLLFDILATPFVAEESMPTASVFEFMLRLFITVSAVVMAWNGFALENVVAVFPIGTLLVGLWVFARVVGRFGMPRRVDLFGSIRETLGASKDFAVYVFLRQLATRADVILLGIFLGAVAAGVYNAAYRIVFMLIFLPYFAGMSLLPQATRLFEAGASTDPDATRGFASVADGDALRSTSEEKVRNESSDAASADATDSVADGLSYGGLLSRALNAVMVLAVPLSVGLWLIAPETIGLLYGDDQFLDSVWVLRWLSGLVLLAFVKLMLGTFLTAGQRQRERVHGQWIAAVVNVVGNLALIPLLGLRGAAIATLAAEFGAVVYYWIRLRQFVPDLRFPTFLLPATVGSAAFVVLFESFWRPPLFAIILVSALIYAVVVSLSPSIRKEGAPLLVSMATKGDR